MKKLKLDMDTLRVDSFGTVPSAAARDGVRVRAHEDTFNDSMCGSQCLCSPDWDWGTCGDSCRSAPCVCNIGQGPG